MLSDRGSAASAYIERRRYLATAFVESTNSISSSQARRVASIVDARPEFVNKTFPSDNPLYKGGTYGDLFESRVQYWFNSFKNIASRKERVKLTLQKVSDEFTGFQYIHPQAARRAIYSLDRQLTRAEFFLSYMQFVKERDIENGMSGLSGLSREHLEYVFDSMIGEIESVSDISRLDHIPDLKNHKLDIIKARMEIKSPSPLQDAIVDHLFDSRGSDPRILEFFTDESLIEKLYYDSSKRKYAIYQFDQKYSLPSINLAFQEGRIQPPGVRQERKIISEVQQTLDRQFPQNSYTKNEVLNYIERSLRTSQAEARSLNSSRVNFNNWSETPELLAIDFPDIFSSKMQSSFDRKQLLEYLIGYSNKIPRFVRHNILGDDGEKTLKDFKRRFTQSPQIVRSMIIQPLFDRQIGILAEPDLTNDINRIILGGKYDEPIIKRLFESYLDAAPESERRVIYSYIMSSFVDSPPTARGASLKTILEAMGPFGVKAGQFLSTSGLLPIEYSRELRDFLSNALPPSRSRVISDLENGLGLELRGIVTIDDQLGSGSINYVQGVKAEVDGNQVDAVVRIRRDYVEGIIANENDIWMDVVRDLRSSGDPIEKNIADIVEEARRQSMSTLAAHGIELDLSIERENFPVAQQTYGMRFNGGTLKNWEIRAASPINELQELIDPEKQKLFSFYDRVDHTPLESIPDRAMREEIAKAIISAELNALFENGVYDPDGHPGNWLIDLDKKQIVRIDYAQLRKIPESERLAFKDIFSELIKPRPNFSSAKSARQLASLLTIDISEEDLIRAIQSASRKTSFGSWGNPQEKLFALRNAIQGELSGPVGTTVNLSDTLRSGMASLGKVSGFSEHLPRSSYLALLEKHTEVPKMMSLVARWSHRLRSTRGVTRTPNRAEARSNSNRTPLPNSLSEIQERGIPSSRESIRDRNESSAQRVAHMDRQPQVENTRYFTRIDFNNWEPKDPQSIFQITPEEYERLPNGTEIYNIFNKKKYIKGVNRVNQDTRGGRIAWGVLGSDYSEGGGPKIASIITGPPQHLDLSRNPYYTDENGARIILLRPDELSEVPDGTILFKTDGKRFIKGIDEIENTGHKEIMGFLNFGFPDADQVGFEDFGVSLSAQTSIKTHALPQSTGALSNRSRRAEGCIQNALRQLVREAITR